MSKPGAGHAESIRDSLVCLKCGYSLRGLSGDVVTCPECGERINIVALVTQQWRDPWFRAPLYNVLVLPLAWALFILLVVGIGLIANLEKPAAFPIALTILLGGAAVWLSLVYVAAKKYGSLEAAFLAMLLHLLFGGYLFGLIGVIVSIVGLFRGLFVARDLLLNVIIMVVCIGLVVAARVGERFVARRCIRQHLRRLSKV